MATHSSILALGIPWKEEPGGLQSMGLQRVGHDWATELNWYREQSKQTTTKKAIIKYTENKKLCRKSEITKTYHLNKLQVIIIM